MGGGLWGGLAGIGLGLIKHNQDMAKYNQEKQRNADIERYSYLTGNHGQMPENPGSSFGSMLQGGLSGAMMGQGMGGGAGAGAGGSPWAGLMGGGAGGQPPMSSEQLPQDGQYQLGDMNKKSTLFGMR